MSSNMRDILREKKQNHISNLITHKGKQSLSKISNDPVTIRHANFFTVVPVSAEVTPYTKIDECYKRLNKCLKKPFKENKEDLFDFRCSVGFVNPKVPDGSIMTCFSNLGPVYIKPPVKDLYLLNLDFKQAFPEMILITYAIIDERNDRNEFHAQLRYGCNGLTKKQTMILSKSLKHYLETCNTNNSLSDTLKELKEFQSEFLFNDMMDL